MSAFVPEVWRTRNIGFTQRTYVGLYGREQAQEALRAARGGMQS
jgi:hypothetical protein